MGYVESRLTFKLIGKPVRCIVRKTKGIIIKSVDYGESDKIITILNEHGAKILLW